MLASMVLILIMATDLMMEKFGAPGRSSFDSEQYLDGKKRRHAIGVYGVIICCQLVGICISHQIIRYKNRILLKLKRLKAAASFLVTTDADAPKPPPLPQGQNWHFFLVGILLIGVSTRVT
jgi:hypothetical protein